MELLNSLDLSNGMSAASIAGFFKIAFMALKFYAAAEGS
jgi:hypothetical protein